MHFLSQLPHHLILSISPHTDFFVYLLVDAPDVGQLALRQSLVIALTSDGRLTRQLETQHSRLYISG